VPGPQRSVLLGHTRDDATNTTAPTTSVAAAMTSASVNAAPTPLVRRSSTATMGGPAVWPMLHSAVTSPVVAATWCGRSRLTSCSAKYVIAVNGRPSRKLPRAKPAAVGSARLIAIATDWTR